MKKSAKMPRSTNAEIDSVLVEHLIPKMQLLIAGTRLVTNPFSVLLLPVPTIGIETEGAKDYENDKCDDYFITGTTLLVFNGNLQ